MRTIAGAQLERLLDGGEPLDAGPPPGEARPLDLLLERVVSHLNQAIARSFDHGDPEEPVALARLACAVGEDGPHAELMAAVLGLLDRYEDGLAPPPPGSRYPEARAPADRRDLDRADARRAAARPARGHRADARRGRVGPRRRGAGPRDLHGLDANAPAGPWKLFHAPLVSSQDYSRGMRGLIVALTVLLLAAARRRGRRRSTSSA